MLLQVQCKLASTPPPRGTEKLNRSYQPYGSSYQDSNTLSNLLINPVLGGLTTGSLAIGGVNV